MDADLVTNETAGAAPEQNILHTVCPRPALPAHNAYSSRVFR